MAHQIAAIWTTLSDLQGHSPTASIAKCDFLRSWVAVHNISTDIVCLSRSPSATAKILVQLWNSL